jgi:hypothetical protein
MHPDVSLQQPWAFEGTFAQASVLASATSGEAYYFLNDADLDSLAIPYPGAPFSGGTSPSPAVRRGDAPTLSLTAAHSEETEAAAATVRISLRRDAVTGPDGFDQVGPPTRFSAVGLRLIQPQPEGSLIPAREQALAHEWRSVPSSGHTFDLRLSSSEDGLVTVDLNGLAAAGAEDAALLDPETGRSYDIGSGPVEIAVKEGTVALQFAMGTSAYVADQETNVRPDAISLDAYPNPVRSDAALVYTLPEAASVQLVVYDVLGRQVARLVDKRKDAGQHRVALPSDRLASGVYFGRLHVGGRTLTQKIVVVR